jgi:lysophospholipase L1-like esterase
VASSKGSPGKALRLALAMTLALVMTGLLAGTWTGARSASAAVSGPGDGPYYVALGDSYSIGYQPAPTPGATSGYTGPVAREANLQLVNFGCGGATTASILLEKGCSAPFGPPASTAAIAYPDQTQAEAAESFIREHRGEIGLITVSIGGNDVTRCEEQRSSIACFASALGALRSNVSTLAEGLRAAAGPHVPLLGLTYPDVLLGLWVHPPGGTDQILARVSVSAFRSFINPTLARAYSAAGGTFVDITADTGAYVPRSETVSLAPYGTVPVAVTRVCQLTWYCARGNIHANTAGYRVMSSRILATYERLRRVGLGPG